MIYMIWLRISVWKWKRTVSVVSHESQSGRGEREKILEGTEESLAGKKDSRGAKGEERGRKGEKWERIDEQERSSFQIPRLAQESLKPLWHIPTRVEWPIMPSCSNSSPRA